MADSFLLEEAVIPPRPVGQTPVLSRPGTAWAPDGNERSTLAQYLAELDLYYEAVKTFADDEPDLVLQQIAAFSGRLTEIRARLNRSGSANANQLRIKEIDPLLSHLDFQFRIASRRLSSRDMEFRLSGGGV